MTRKSSAFGWMTGCVLVMSFVFVSGATPAAKPEFHTAAFLIEKDAAPKKIELVAATRTSIRYQVPGGSRDGLDFVLHDGDVVQVGEPEDFTASMNLYRARRYQEARAKLVTVKDRYRPIEGLEDSISTLAAFYEMECLRKEGYLEALATALQKFSKGPLSREYQSRQLELYVLWDAVRTKSWERLESLAKERANVRLPGDQRAQVAYCLGLALEGLGRPGEALISYNTAITADAGASEVVTRQAALRILAIYHDDPAVKAAVKLGKNGNPDPPSSGAVKLIQAQSVARLFELSLGAGLPLPSEFAEFRVPQAGK
jgi:hypothetical protein